MMPECTEGLKLLPDCMSPDGDEPCYAYKQLQSQLDYYKGQYERRAEKDHETLKTELEKANATKPQEALDVETGEKVFVSADDLEDLHHLLGKAMHPKVIYSTDAEAMKNEAIDATARHLITARENINRMLNND